MERQHSEVVQVASGAGRVDSSRQGEEPSADRPAEAGRGASARKAADSDRSSGANSQWAALRGRVLDSLLEGCQIVGLDYRYLYVNEAVARQAKSSPEALVGRTMMECFPGIERTQMFANLRVCMEELTPRTLENEFVFPDGSTGVFELRMEPIPEGTLILSVDVTGRKRAEAERERAVQLLSTLCQCNQVLVQATNEKSLAQEICDLIVQAPGFRGARIRLEEMIAGEGAIEVRAANPIPEENAGGIWRSLDLCATGVRVGSIEVLDSDAAGLSPEEEQLLAEIARDVGYGIDVLRARAARSNLEEQLVASQRLEAVGRLAGGIAHDFNNLLTVISTYTSFALQDLAEGDPLHADLEQVQEAGRRAATLTRQLLAFSRKQILEPRVVNLNEVIRGLEGMMRRLLGEDITIFVSLAENLGNVRADPGQIEQVIMNLAVNARDAMPSGGRLTIDTANAELDEDYAAAHISTNPGRYVRIAVTDTGTGMSEETKRRIFEPFFTTKEKDKGTGLGLSTVYGIVKQSGGNIWVYSEPGHGTSVKVYLPRIDAPVYEPRRRQGMAPYAGSEVVLLVEDDSSVRTVTERILRGAGYRVLTARSGKEARQMCETLSVPIDLLLTDVVMPEMSGRELAEALIERWPSMKVVFTSGYTDDAIVQHGVLAEGVHFVGKPFSSADLTRKLREALSERPVQRAD